MGWSPRVLFLTALACWCACVIIGLVAGPPLTSDEAAYAMLARGVDAAWPYRPIGFVAFAKLGVLAGDSDVAARLPCALASPLLLVAVAALGRRFGAWVGPLAACVLASTHTIVLRAVELLDDIPATTCLVAALVVIVDELDRDEGPRYRLVAAAPLLAAAFYLRYGTIPVIALVAAAALVLWWQAVRARPGPVIATAAVLAVLLVPFAIDSYAVTGSVGGILVMAGDVSGRLYVGEGLPHYWGNNPFRMYGVAITPVMVAGLVAIVRPPPRRRAAWFIAIVAIGEVVALGMTSHASTRFVFLPMALMSVLGVDMLERVLRGRWRAGAVAAVLVACGAMIAAAVPLDRTITRHLASTVAAARAIRADAAGRPCTVIARATPQVMWYSGCAAVKITSATAAVPLDPQRLWYAASTPRRPIDPEALAAACHADVLALAPGGWAVRPRK